MYKQLWATVMLTLEESKVVEVRGAQLVYTKFNKLFENYN